MQNGACPAVKKQDGNLPLCILNQRRTGVEHVQLAGCIAVPGAPQLLAALCIECVQHAQLGEGIKNAVPFLQAGIAAWGKLVAQGCFPEFETIGAAQGSQAGFIGKIDSLAAW